MSRLIGIRLPNLALIAAIASAGLAVTPPLSALAASTDWPTYHGDNFRSAYDPNEPTTTSVASAWKTAGLDGTVYAEPLFISGVTVGSSVLDLVIVATEGDSLYAFNSATGVQVWRANVGTPVTLTIPPFGCGNISPLGILGTPVVDRAAGIVYAVAFEMLGAGVDHYYLVGRDLATGAQSFSQVLIEPAGFDPHFQQQRSALTLANGYVYAPFGGYAGDCGTYHGWIVGTPATGSGTQVTFNDQSTLPGSMGAREAALWATSGPSVDASGNLYMTSGNGGSNTPSVYDFGETLFKLSPTLSRLGYWAPTQWNSLNGSDSDLGSVGPLLVGPTHNLVFQIGKSGWGYLVNALTLSATGSINNGLFSAQVCNAATSDTAARDQVFGGLAYVDPYIYVPCPEGIKAVLLNSSAPSFSVAWTSSPSFHAGPPVVGGGIVWAINTNGGILYGLNPSNGVALISANFGSTNSRFDTPAIGGGKIFVPTGTQVAAYNLVSGPATYFPWYDFATPGIQSDYFAVANPGPNWANVLIQLPGALPLSFGVPHGTAKYVTFPHGTAGGPVTVTTDGEPVLVSQRVVYYNSANERAAVPAAALSTSLSWPWYDWATAGFESDYFYVGNPGGTAANVTISLPGATPIHLTLAAGSGAGRTFPHGTAGGPVTLSSDQPVLASQRVLYANSFTDIPASLPSSAGTQLVFPVYYWASPDFGSDYFYVANLGASPAHVTISLAGVTPITLTVAAGSAGFRTFPYGTAGGPVRVSSDQPVLASQRVLYNQSAMETAASLAGSAATSFHFPIYFWSGPDLQSDYFYITNPGPNWANILISMPGAPLLSFGVPHGTTKAVTWPRGTGGGPVTVTTDGEPVLISQRTVFDQSAWEFTSPLGS